MKQYHCRPWGFRVTFFFSNLNSANNSNYFNRWWVRSRRVRCRHQFLKWPSLRVFLSIAGTPLGRRATFSTSTLPLAGRPRRAAGSFRFAYLYNCFDGLLISEFLMFESDRTNPRRRRGGGDKGVAVYIHGSYASRATFFLYHDVLNSIKKYFRKHLFRTFAVPWARLFRCE